MDKQFSLIMTIVDRGCGDEVMACAKEEGARGGTIIYGRGTGAEEAVKFFNITIQEEKEVVMIVCPAEHRQNIMTAIVTKAGLNSPCHGITFSLPIEDVRGIKWIPEEKESEDKK